MAEVDFYRKVENIVRLTAPTIRGYLQGSVKSSGLKIMTSKLSKGFPERVMKDGLEVWAVKFKSPRYGFIQNAGMESKTVNRGDSSYTHPGFPARNFIGDPVQRGTVLLRDRLSIVSRDMVMDEIAGAFE